jgi:hypothetical protein
VAQCGEPGPNLKWHEGSGWTITKFGDDELEALLGTVQIFGRIWIERTPDEFQVGLAKLGDGYAVSSLRANVPRQLSLNFALAGSATASSYEPIISRLDLPSLRYRMYQIRFLYSSQTHLKSLSFYVAYRLALS